MPTPRPSRPAVQPYADTRAERAAGRARRALPGKPPRRAAAHPEPVTRAMPTNPVVPPAAVRGRRTQSVAHRQPNADTRSERAAGRDAAAPPQAGRRHRLRRTSSRHPCSVPRTLSCRHRPMRGRARSSALPAELLADTRAERAAGRETARSQTNRHAGRVAAPDDSVARAAPSNPFAPPAAAPAQVPNPAARRRRTACSRERQRSASCPSTSWTPSAKRNYRHQRAKPTPAFDDRIHAHGRGGSQDLRPRPILAHRDRLHRQGRRNDPGDGLVPREQRSERRHAAPQLRGACRARSASSTEPHLKQLEAEIAKLFPNSKVRLRTFGQRIIVLGQARDVSEAAEILNFIRGEQIDASGQMGLRARPGRRNDHGSQRHGSRFDVRYDAAATCMRGYDGNHGLAAAQSQRIEQLPKRLVGPHRQHAQGPRRTPDHVAGEDRRIGPHGGPQLRRQFHARRSSSATARSCCNPC